MFNIRFTVLNTLKNTRNYIYFGASVRRGRSRWSCYPIIPSRVSVTMTTLALGVMGLVGSSGTAPLCLVWVLGEKQSLGSSLYTPLHAAGCDSDVAGVWGAAAMVTSLLSSDASLLRPRRRGRPSLLLLLLRIVGMSLSKNSSSTNTHTHKIYKYLACNIVTGVCVCVCGTNNNQ